MELQSHLERIEAAGAELWAISGDDADRLRSFAEERGIEFPILHDPEGSTFESYGILNETHRRTVPHPTVIIVDTEGVAKFVVSDDNYKVRPPTLAVVSAVERVAGGGD